MVTTETILEIEKMKESMKQFAYTNQAKIRIDELRPMMSEREVTAALRETTEAKIILEKMGNPPLTSYENMDDYIQIIKAGGCLNEEQLEAIAITLTAVKRLKDFLNRAKQLNIGLPYFEENLCSMDEVREEISRIIRAKRVDDNATKTLKTVREKIAVLENKMREKADAVIRSNKEYMADSYSTTRNGHICIPVKKEYRHRISGSVVGQSSKGSTLFIEPDSVGKYGDELELKRYEEENEVHNILYTLTAIIGEAVEIFEQNKKTMEKLDFAFAKGRISQEYDGTAPEITSERRISIRSGRHPLLDKEICVPLNFSIGDGIRGVVITGPNTGGKTVAIKTVGINCYLAQCGLHVACEAAVICLNNQILCDIGDGQNLSENLSTFSSHIVNVLDILRRADRQSLIIMDELGSGTDPTEGMGIAIAILRKLDESGAFYLVTTHYPDVKNYAEQAEGVLNARMKFDRETLRPLYQLEIGKAGESCALYIAKKLGMPADMLKMASAAAYGEAGEELYQNAQAEKLEHLHTVKLTRDKTFVSQQTEALKYNLGDSVMVYPDKKIGIVCEKANEKGILRIQMPNKKIYISHKRIKLHVAAEALYPADYDFSIIFHTVEERKVRHDMARKHVADVVLKVEE